MRNVHLFNGRPASKIRAFPHRDDSWKYNLTFPLWLVIASLEENAGQAVKDRIPCWKHPISVE
jgi:hypothetical protein